MYLGIIAVFILLGGGLFLLGIHRQRRYWVGIGVGVWLLTGVGFALLSFWGELLWFRELGFSRRFWTVVLSRISLSLIGALLGWLVVYVLTLAIPRGERATRLWPEAAGALVGALTGLGSWEVVLKFLHRVPTEMTDPILGRDAGFYLFSLPFYDRLQDLFSLLVMVALAAALTALSVRSDRNTASSRNAGHGEWETNLRLLSIPLAALLFVFAWALYLRRFHLMTSSLGIVTGPGWTDVHVVMPGLLIAAAITLVGGLMLIVAPARSLVRGWVSRFGVPEGTAGLVAVFLPVALAGGVWLITIQVAPALTQWLRVEPNEITLEREFIEHNIRFTRHGFAMTDMEEREYAMSGRLTPAILSTNQDLMSEVRLWDWRALADVFEQFQEIRLYYSFPDVDIDRYRIGEDYRQVMVSPREMELGNLPADSQTFVNQRFKYTHGYGLTMSTVREFTSEGLPNLLISDIPPESTHPSLHVARPEIYYGVLTTTPVVANTKEAEFDYPSGDRNVYSHYEGHGGVPLSSLFRKFVYGWKFDGTRFFLSSYPTRESRVLFHRHVLERARRVAPFLRFEADPYVVLHDGRLYWIIDAYTTSTEFPYSEPFPAREQIETGNNQAVPGWRGALTQTVAPQFRGANYVRNAVKVVVDAYHGDLSFYVFEPQDPILRVWQSVFPELFQAKEEMPAGLRAHIRYPATWLLTQGLVYAKYHMTDPAVFYNQEDLWIRATEKYYQQVHPVEPYYIMWKPPDSGKTQFVLILPFTPKNKQVLIGWMAGMCDGERYGQLLAYKFPKEKRILGPQQVETKIDQDRQLSGQLTLWDQRGSRVIRGNVLAIPLSDTLLYVEPIYLQAETAAYPELRLVAVMHDDNLSYAPTFREALEGLFPDGEAQSAADSTTVAAVDDGQEKRLIGQAQRAFENYLRLQGEADFAGAAARLEDLKQALDQLAAGSRRTGEKPAAEPEP